MCAPLEVEVLPEAGHSDRTEAQGRKGDRPSEGSVEGNHGPTYRNRIRGGADQGERATDRKALVAKGTRRKSGGGVVKGCVLTGGDLASRLKGRRPAQGRSEESAEAIVAAVLAAKGQTKTRARRAVASTRQGPR